MTGPRVDVPQTPDHILSGDEWEASHYLPGASFGAAIATPKQPVPATSRILSGDEWEHAQTLSGPALRSWQVPAMPVIARDATATKVDAKKKNTAGMLPGDVAAAKAAQQSIEDYGKGQGGLSGVLKRQIVAPALANPFTTVAMLGAPAAAAAVAPLAGLAVGGAMAGSMVYHVAQYGWQKLAESQLSPEDKARAEADPERISGEAAAVQAAMLGLAPLIHVGVKAFRGPAFGAGMMDATGIDGASPGRDVPPPMEIKLRPREVRSAEEAARNADFAGTLEDQASTTRIPADVSKAPGFTPTAGGATLKGNPRAPQGLETTPEGVKAGKVKPIDAQSPADEVTALSEARRADAERIAKADAMRPRRRPAGEKVSFVMSEQGAETLGMAAGRHGLAADANPYHPEDPNTASLAAAWSQGHGAATESFPDGFSMGGALTDNRIPGAGEIPPTARGIDGLQQSHPAELPEGVTPESVALANSLKPSRFRGHTTDDLASAALDTQTAIEEAQAAQQRARQQGLVGEAAQADMENRGSSYSNDAEGPSKTADKQLAAATSRMAQIEREFALRGVHSDELAGIIQGAKEARAEREGMAQDEHLAGVTGDFDPFADPAPVAAPVAAGEGSAQALAPVGTGELKTRGLSEGVQRKAIVNKVETGLDALPEYATMNKAEQGAKALDLLASDPALARQIAMGDAHPPAHLDLTPEAVFIAVENKAILDGDVATIRDLATSKRTGEATAMGQRISMLSERDPESPVGAIRKVMEVRMGGAKNVPRATEETVAALRKQLSNVEVTHASWAEFVNSLRC